ncbi:MAG: NTPase [Candidatus Thermoplasmatota archaeon]|nr:NTPase [Candidatus Thermoplasmatota archaeon]
MVVPIKIGLTGLPGAGKTETVLRIAAMLEEDGMIVGGMVTDAVMEKGERAGFYVQDIRTKEKKVFAHETIESRSTIGKYGVDLGALEEVGVKAITGAVADADVIVIDEVGRMEVESPAFVEAVQESLDSEKPMILTLHKKSRNPLLQDIRRRDDVRILEVTIVNRNLLPYKVVSLLKGETL